MKVTRDIFAAPETAHEAAPAEETAPADDTDEATAEGMDPEAAADEDEAMAENEAMTDEMADEPSPFEPVEMTIDKLALHLLGASANATGHFKMVEGAGMEVPPAGELHAEFEGINKLIDTLGSMGLIPEDQMMGVRMMLAMFAKPVEGNPDKMTTDLEVKEDGSVFANGQQIK